MERGGAGLLSGCCFTCTDRDRACTSFLSATTSAASFLALAALSSPRLRSRAISPPRQLFSACRLWIAAPAAAGAIFRGVGGAPAAAWPVLPAAPSTATALCQRPSSVPRAACSTLSRAAACGVFPSLPPTPHHHGQWWSSPHTHIRHGAGRGGGTGGTRVGNTSPCGSQRRRKGTCAASSARDSFVRKFASSSLRASTFSARCVSHSSAGARLTTHTAHASARQREAVARTCVSRRAAATSLAWARSAACSECTTSAFSFNLTRRVFS
jgi:hypothetical protein